MTKQIMVEAILNVTREEAWKFYTEPKSIKKWAFASDDWQAPKAENDLKKGGRFLTRMEAKDGSAGFDFTGTYTEVVPNEKIAYTMDGDDKRTVRVTFEDFGNSVHIKVFFDPENENPIEMQKSGWQSILENFKKYAEDATSV